MESRTPPNSLDAEMSVLGAILLDNDVYGNLEGRLTPEHFYKEAHRKIFRAIERLHRRSEPMDLVTLTEELRTSGELEGVGSINYLIGLADSVPTAAYADSYARIVSEKAELRDLISVSGRIMQSAFDQALPVVDVMDQAESAILDLATKKRRSSFEGMRTLVTETFADINERFANPNPVSGLRTGFRELDQMTAGLQKSTLNVLAARPAMGKTAFAMTIALNAALELAEVDVVLLDSGVRTGADVVKAVALGAAAVLYGRPYIYGLGLGGQAGVEHVLRCLLGETDVTMALSGRRSLAELGSDLFVTSPG